MYRGTSSLTKQAWVMAFALVTPFSLCYSLLTVHLQSQLEDCLRAEGVEDCIVSDDVTDRLGGQFKNIAPGYLAAGMKPSTFMDHEYFKHGSCEKITCQSLCLLIKHLQY
jgi:hypothetical protein